MTRDEYKKSLEGLPEDKINSLLADFDNTQSEINGLKDERKSLITDRDTAKKRVNSLLDKLGTDEDGNPKTTDKQINDLKQKIADFENQIADRDKQITELTPFKEKSTKLENDRREELINLLPENEQLRSVAKKITSLEDLKEYVTVTNESLGKKANDGGRGGKGHINTDGKKWDDFTFADRQELKKNQKEIYDKLFKEKYPNSN